MLDLFGLRGAHPVHAADWKNSSTAPSAAIAEVSFLGNMRGLRLVIASWKMASATVLQDFLMQRLPQSFG